MSDEKRKIGVYGMVPIALLQDEAATKNMLKVYTALASYQGGGDSCWPSVAKIAERAGVRANAVSEATDKLEEAGWIRKARRSNQRQTNKYEVLVDVEPEDKTPYSGKPGNPENPENARIPENPENPLYEKNKEKNTREPNGSLSKTTSTPQRKHGELKDTDAALWEHVLTAKQPSSTWSNFGKERSDCKNLARRSRELLEQTPYNDMRELITAVVEEYDRLKRTERSSWWRTAAWTPSQLLSHWSAIWESLSRRNTVVEVDF